MIPSVDGNSRLGGGVVGTTVVGDRVKTIVDGVDPVDKPDTAKCAGISKVGVTGVVDAGVGVVHDSALPVGDDVSNSGLVDGGFLSVANGGESSSSSDGSPVKRDRLP